MKLMMNKTMIRGQQRARKIALQALYQWHMSNYALNIIEEQFYANNNMEKIDKDYFKKLLYEIPANIDVLKQQITPFLDRELHDPIELTVLNIGTYELLYCTEIPYKVIIDEAIILTKEFGSQDGYRYVNGVLNQIARQVRAQEITQ